jgi:hypothetical protein
MSDEPDSDDVHILRRWFSVGDLLSAVATLVALGAVWGSLSKDVANLQDEVSDLKTMSRGMTPGAAEALATIKAKDSAQDQQLVELRYELRESRAEILGEVRALRDELINHDRSGK